MNDQLLDVQARLLQSDNQTEQLRQTQDLLVLMVPKFNQLKQDNQGAHFGHDTGHSDFLHSCTLGHLHTWTLGLWTVDCGLWRTVDCGL